MLFEPPPIVRCDNGFRMSSGETMTGHSAEHQTFLARLRVLLPEDYRDRYEEVQPVSMGSAGLKFGSDGCVAWNEIWQSFCDLAMAGGPPHKGSLLEPASRAAILREQDRYREVTRELCRGIEMVTGLAAEPSLIAGWIHVDCPSATMAGWLVRAINMENVSAYASGMVLHLPAGPQFRVEKEIKNVVTAIAKTCHYWLQHMSAAQHRDVADLFEIMESESPFIQAPFSTQETRGAEFEALRDRIAADIPSLTGLEATGRSYHGWLGIDCKGVRPAIEMMRAVSVCNVLCRREGNLAYVPVNPITDGGGETVARAVGRASRLAGAKTA